MRRCAWLVLLTSAAVSASCVSPASTTCDDEVLCPRSQVCAAGACVDPGRLEPCVDDGTIAPDDTVCSYQTLPGVCRDGVCIWVG